MPEVINEDGRQLTWTAKYMRYGYPSEEECDSLGEAIGFLYWGEESDGLVGVEIIGPDGRLVEASWDELPGAEEDDDE